MSAQPLGEGVDDDVRTMIDGTLQIRGAEGGIHDQRQPMIVRNFGDGLDISYIQPGIAHRFAEEQLGLGGNGLGKILRIIRVHKVGVDIELRKDVFELRVAASVKIIGRNDFITRLAQVDDGIEIALVPDAKASAAAPLSRAATRCSSTS